MVHGGFDACLGYISPCHKEIKQPEEKEGERGKGGGWGWERPEYTHMSCLVPLPCLLAVVPMQWVFTKSQAAGVGQMDRQMNTWRFLVGGILEVQSLWLCQDTLCMHFHYLSLVYRTLYIKSVSEWAHVPCMAQEKLIQPRAVVIENLDL